METMVKANAVNFSNEFENENAILAIPNDSNSPRERAFTTFGGIKTFAEDVSVNDAIDLSGLDYVVGQRVLFATPENSARKIIMGEENDYKFTGRDAIESHKAIVREDTGAVLGVVGAEYGIVQNKSAFEFIDLLRSNEYGANLRIQSAGVFGQGERMFIEAKMPDDIFVGGRNEENRINDYILFSNGHDGSRAFEVFFTPVRVWCQNTLNMALKGAKNKLIYKHTKNVCNRVDWTQQENINKAVATLEMHKYFKDEFVQTLENLNRIKVDDEIINNFVASIYLNEAQAKLARLANNDFQSVDEISTRSKNLIYGLKGAIQDGIGQQTYRGTALWLLNGLTTYYQNGTRFANGEVMANSILDGDVAKKVQKGYDFLSRLAA